MANKYMDSTLLDKAIIYAVKAHANTERRGKGFPYIVHPMEAMEIVATITSDQELLAAAALHDVVEDTDVTIEEIREQFGDKVAALVATESEEEVKDKSLSESWHERKQAAIDRLAEASYEGKIVALGDKLSNMRAIYRDWMVIGDQLWNRFHCSDPREHEWHYRGLATSLSDLVGTFAYNEFTDLIGKVFGEPKPELVNMDEWEESGDGFTAISYNHKDGKRMMKLYADFIPTDVPAKELNATWNIQRLGLTIPSAYRLVTDGKRVGVEFERITPKKSFARAISNEPDSWQFYADEFAKEVAKLHSTRCDTTAFPNVKDIYRNIVKENPNLTGEQKDVIYKFINDVPDCDTCVHGDLHIGNIITNGEKNYWIDLGDFAYGHPYFDLACLHLQCRALPDELIHHLYHISREQMRAVGDRVMKHFFPNAEGYEDIKKTLYPFAALYMIGYDNKGKMMPEMRIFINKAFGF